MVGMEVIQFFQPSHLLAAAADKVMYPHLAEPHLLVVAVVVEALKMVLAGQALLDKDMRAEMLVVRQITFPAVAVAVQEQ
jgi:hypothetical protein